MKKTGDKNHLTNWEVATYSLGSLGSAMSGACGNTFLFVCLCVYMRLNPLYISTAFVLARIWDAVNDPMLAALVNNCKKSRYGRYRPWIFWGSIVTSVFLVLMFYPIHPAREWVRYLYYIAMYVFWGMSSTVLNVPFAAMLPTIADTTDERNRVSSFAQLIGGFGGFSMNTIGTSFIFPKFASQGMEKAYLILAITATACLLFFINFTVIFNREKYDIPYNKVGLKTIMTMFKSNDQLRAYAVSYVFNSMASGIAMGPMLYLYTYSYENGADLLSSVYSFTLFWIVACTGQGITMMFYTLIARRIPREKIYSFSYVLQILGYLLLFLVFFFLKPGAKYHLFNSIVVALCGAFFMLGSGMQGIGSAVMIADVVDYGEWKTGLRGDSVIFSVQTLLGKFAGALATLITGVGISASGLPKMQEALDPETQTAVQQFVDAAGNAVDPYTMIGGNSLTILRAFMFLVPIPLCIVSFITYKKKYWLGGEKYQKVKEEINARRGWEKFEEPAEG